MCKRTKHHCHTDISKVNNQFCTNKPQS